MKKKVVYVLVAVIALIIVILVIGGSFKFNVSFDGQEQDQDIVKNIDWETYRNDTAGFSLNHPSAWKVEEIASEGREVIIYEPGAFGFVHIRAMYDPNINSLDTVKASMEDYRQSLLNDSMNSTVLSDFKSAVEGTRGGFFAFGDFVYKEMPYRFQEQGLVGTDGRILIIRGAAYPQAYDQLKPVIDEVIKSFSVS